MLSTLQIVLLAVAGASAIASIVFMVMFIVEITVSHKEEDTAEVQSVFSTNNYVTVNIEEKEENKAQSVNEMLEKLEEQTKEEAKEEPAVESVQEVKEEPAVQEVENEVEEAQPVQEVEEKEEIVEEKAESTEEKEEVVEEKAEEKEEIVSSKKETPVEELAEISETDSKDEKDDEEDEDDGELELLSDFKELKSESHEIVTNGSVIDYKTRLEKIVETRNKIDRDLSKIQKAILKYERTKRRKNRNQKMLDRRAGELTNLNLVMYSVTDIKNVDEEKKVKQEELTAHIAELKASIQDAEEFIESNKEKNDHNVKMAKFLLQEKARYNEEISELQALIKATEDADNK